MLNQIYTEVILTHNRQTPHRGEIDAPDFVERGHNPNCGDDLTLMVKLEADKIAQAKFIGSGCAISTASMSIMIDVVKGKSLSEARDLTMAFLGLIKGEPLELNVQKRLKDAMLFSGISEMPARVKCATLGWHCLKVVVDKSLEALDVNINNT